MNVLFVEEQYGIAVGFYSILTTTTFTTTPLGV